MQNQSALCELCGEPMPPGEQMFKYHGYSGGCPKPPKPKQTEEMNHTCRCEKCYGYRTKLEESQAREAIYREALEKIAAPSAHIEAVEEMDDEDAMNDAIFKTSRERRDIARAALSLDSKARAMLEVVEAAKKVRDDYEDPQFALEDLMKALAKLEAQDG